MQSDDEAPLTLSKWPFYLGDILLVATALAIAILGNWQLTDMQVISCVVAVALGAAIFVLPFVVEYSMRVKEEADDRSSEMALLKAHLQKSEAALRQYHERLQVLESGSSSEDQRYELLASAVDHKLHAESQNLATLAQQVAVVESFKAEQVEALTAVQAQLNSLSAAVDQSSAPSQEVVAFETRLKDALEPLVALQKRLDEVEETMKAAATEVQEPVPPRAPRQRRIKNEAGLLHRAIKEKQDSSSSAVSRIIDSKSKLIVPEAEPVVQPDADVEPVVIESEPEVEETVSVPEVTPVPEAVAESEPIVEPEPVQIEEPASMEASAETGTPEPVAEPVEEPAAIETKAPETSSDSAAPVAPPTDELVVELDPIDEVPEDFSVSLGADLIEDDELLEATASETAKASTEGVVKAESVKEAAEEPKSEAKDLFGEVAAPAGRRARTKADDAILTVSILIGIGNKPFLRGSGGGLSWESGLAMDFEEIGKWRWVAPTDLESPVEVQVYRNDEDADRKGRYTLEPGQKLEVSPVF